MNYYLQNNEIKRGFFNEKIDQTFVGNTGNDDAVFHDGVDKAKAEGLTPSLYCHGLGTFGHGAGPIIGRWDHQDSIYPGGEFPVGENTAYALELNITDYVPEWEQDVCFMMEETISFTGGKTCFNDDYRDQIILVK